MKVFNYYIYLIKINSKLKKIIKFNFKINILLIMSNNIFPISYRPADVKSFTYNYIAKKLMEKKNIEIELRMGYFYSEDSYRSLKKHHYELSYQNPFIVNSTVKEDKKFLDSLVRDFKYLDYKFRPNLENKEFYRVLELMDKFKKEGEIKKNEVMVDFITSSKKRFTWNLTKNEVAENTKKNKENIDFLHQGKEYRLSSAEENFILIKDIEKLVKSNTFKFIRVKFRTHYYYQFMDFCFTKTISLFKSYQIKYLVDLVTQSFSNKFSYNENIKKIMAFINKNNLKSENEVEVEIIDADYLKNLIVNNIIGFRSCIDRLFRNFEILYLNKDVAMQNSNYIKFCKNEGLQVVFPVIGSYLEKIYK